MVRGESRTKSAMYLGEKVYYTEWMDRKLVRVLHTIPTFKGSCVRQMKDGISWQRKAYLRPSIIPMYNQGMGGTDAGDQRAQCYRPHLKTVSWLPSIFSHFLNIAVVNSFILCSTIRSMKLPKTHLEFRELLITHLIEPNRVKRILQPAARPTRHMSRKTWELETARLLDAHYPAQTPTSDDKKIESRSSYLGGSSGTRNWVRRDCILCGVLVATHCRSCEVYLCLRDGANGKNCFESFHTDRIFTCIRAKSTKKEDSDDEEVII